MKAWWCRWMQLVCMLMFGDMQIWRPAHTNISFPSLSVSFRFFTKRLPVIYLTPTSGRAVKSMWLNDIFSKIVAKTNVSWQNLACNLVACRLLSFWKVPNCFPHCNDQVREFMDCPFNAVIWCQWHVAALCVCVWKCVYMCVSDSTAGEGREWRDANWNSFSHVWQSLGVWVAHTHILNWSWP